jgi:hypothetical protein
MKKRNLAVKTEDMTFLKSYVERGGRSWHRICRGLCG